MARYWQEVRAEDRAKDRLDEKRIAAHRQRLRAQVRTHPLAEIRQAAGLNQSDLASRLGVSQSRVSRLERGEIDRTEVATVRAYVTTLGGEVELVARFGDERFTIG